MSNFRNSRTYDLLTASPLIVFNAFAVAGVIVRMAQAADTPLTLSRASEFLNLLAYAAAMVFVVIQTIFLIVRKLPLRFSQSLFSRVVALAGSNGGLLLPLLLPPASLTLTLQIVSSVLILVGASASTFVVIWLGKGFSILPQARQLTVQGPYRFVRHPLYLSETVTSIGVMLQYAQPWSFLFAVTVTAIQFPRMIYEERVLRSVYPDYDLYAQQTARFLPTIF